MINNEMRNQLSRYLNNRTNQTESGGMAADLFKRLKAKHDSINGKPTAKDTETTEETKDTDKNASKKGVTDQRESDDSVKNHTYTRNVLKNAAKKNKGATDGGSGNKTTTTTDDKLTWQERREKELQAIMDKLNAEEAGRYPYKSSSKESTETKSSIITTENAEETEDSEGFMGFLNDLPLFNEFKTGLMDAFKRLDSASAGSISAQYELNYSSMKYVANAAGGYDYEETTFNLKLDLNYIKAASGGTTGKALSDAVESSTDMASLIENLKKAGQPQAQAQETKKFDPNDMMTSLKDYFSPEKTAGRIVDFATAFFPTSDQFKAKGDTEEARAEFAEIMRKAIQKGFDQAQGILGVVPKETQEGINKTHELSMQGLDDFIKNGLNKNKQDSGVYSALEQFSFSAQMNYSKKTVSVRYGANGEQQTNQQQQNAQPAVDTQA